MRIDAFKVFINHIYDYTFNNTLKDMFKKWVSSAIC